MQAKRHTRGEESMFRSANACRLAPSKYMSFFVTCPHFSRFLASKFSCLKHREPALRPTNGHQRSTFRTPGFPRNHWTEASVLEDKRCGVRKRIAHRGVGGWYAGRAERRERNDPNFPEQQ